MKTSPQLPDQHLPEQDHADSETQSTASRAATAEKYASRYIVADRRFPDTSVFSVDDTTFFSSMPRPTHWSVSWSDLMMTMFILFVVMFAYQAANREFLVNEEPTVVGGDTAEALDINGEQRANLPISPIKPGLPLITAGTVRKVVPVLPEDVETATGPLSDAAKTAQEKIRKDAEAELAKLRAEREAQEKSRAEAETTAPPSEETQPPPPAPTAEDKMQEMYTLSQKNLENYDMEKFAAIDLVPDKTVRIVLTGDLFFETGMAELSAAARESLKKITEVIRKTPYIINIVGHTDNIPMRSDRYSTNWELSVARASRVARFLIEEMGMNPNQFVVSGYASYRPLQPNTDTRGRAANRRVEIIISKKLPPAAPATPENLQ
jgi:chemotaxis protein MotB